MTAIHYQPAVELAAMLRRREIGCLELLDHFLARVERHNRALNAVIWMDAEGARRRAREADAALLRGDVWGPLHGLPMTVKESFDLAGAPTHWGLAAYKDNVAAADSAVVERLKGAGAVIFGKTNVPVLLADWQSFNPVCGTTNNPWALDRVPGGSSGGAAAALAAGLTGLEAGSDIGASIRNPAHYCGVFGHKPTFGIVPSRGHALPGVFATADMAVCGPLGRSAEDLALELGIVAGAEAPDSPGWRLELRRPRKTALKDYRISVMLSDPNSEVDAEYAERLQAVADALARAGAKVSDRARPDIDTLRAHEVYIMLLRAATSGRLTSEDVARFRALAERLGPKDRSYVARMARANTMTHREWLAYNNEREELRHRWAAFFREWDVMICPTAASAAWPHDHKGERHERTIPVNGRRVPTTDQLFWAGLSTLVYLPGTVAPAGLTRSGLPVGAQVIAGHLEDLTAIEVCRLIARETGGFRPPPGYD
ncbi:MAG: amidase [Proteobacteria bacterium]|nr:amidase [Pseudomonadota bacterium]